MLMIIIPFLNGYFIGNIPNIFRQTQIWQQFSNWETHAGASLTLWNVVGLTCHVASTGHDISLKYGHLSGIGIWVHYLFRTP